MLPAPTTRSGTTADSPSGVLLTTTDNLHDTSRLRFYLYTYGITIGEGSIRNAAHYTPSITLGPIASFAGSSKIFN